MKYDEDGKLIGLFGIHVDDILTCGQGSDYKTDIEYLRKKDSNGDIGMKMISLIVDYISPRKRRHVESMLI